MWTRLGTPTDTNARWPTAFLRSNSRVSGCRAGAESAGLFKQYLKEVVQVMPVWCLCTAKHSG